MEIQSQNESRLRKQERWSFQHCGLHVVVVHWGKDELHNDGKGIWNYYIWLREAELGEDFKELWLEDRLLQISPESKGFVTYDYYSLKASQEVEWHGGITYYAKHGYVEGHRSVELGCDFNHLWDHERGYDYTLEEVVAEAKQTAEQLSKVYGKS